jgi:hypothetical protein
MALLTSPRFQIQYPDGSRTDRPDIPLHLTNIVTSLDANGVMFGQGTFANRPVGTPASLGKQGRVYMSSDGVSGGSAGTYILFYDYGTGWALVTGVYAGPPPDSITAIEIAPNAITSAELADGAVDTAAIQDAAVTAAKLAAALKPSQGAGGSTEALRAIGMGAGQVLSSSNLPSIFQAGTRAALPANNVANDSLWYYATDIDVIYFGAGGTWHRIGAQAGDIVWTIENVARFGYVICTGQAWPSTTGAYADLFAKWGGMYPANMPDFQGRQFTAKGTHADVATLSFNDGLAVASRRTKHKHTKNGSASLAGSVGFSSGNHSHGIAGGGGYFVYSTGAGPQTYLGTTGGYNIGQLTTVTDVSGSGVTVNNGSLSVSDTITVGPQTGAEPVDSSAYIVLQPQVKL